MKKKPIKSRVQKHTAKKKAVAKITKPKAKVTKQVKRFKTVLPKPVRNKLPTLKEIEAEGVLKQADPSVLDVEFYGDSVQYGTARQEGKVEYKEKEGSKLALFLAFLMFLAWGIALVYYYLIK